MNYTNTLDKALSYLRELELDKALTLFYQLLQEHPKDLELINRIYPLEAKRPQSPGYLKICLHIFGLQSSQAQLNQLVLETFGDFKKIIGNYNFSEHHTFCLLHHLANSHFHQDSEELAEKIKRNYPNSPQTPEILFLYCEGLINKRKLIQAEKELRYLITYYAEHPVANAAISELKRIEPIIVR